MSSKHLKGFGVVLEVRAQCRIRIRACHGVALEALAKPVETPDELRELNVLVNQIRDEERIKHERALDGQCRPAVFAVFPAEKSALQRIDVLFLHAEMEPKQQRDHVAHADAGGHAAPQDGFDMLEGKK